MAWRDWLPFQTKQNAIVRSVDLFKALAEEGQTGSGVAINYKTAMRVSVVMACARVIANGLAQVPFKLFLEADGKREAAKKHPLYRLLHLKPNDWQTSFELRHQLALHLVFFHNAYVWKNRVGGRTVELLPLEPNWVRVERSGWKSRYFVRMNEKVEQEIPAEEIWHIRGPSWSGWLGLDAVRLAREAIGLALVTETFGAKHFANGAALSGILTTDQNLTPDQRKDLRESWSALHAGAQRAWKTAITWGGIKFQPVASQNDQAQFLETRRFQIEEVCRHMGVLPIMVGHADKTATYASAEAMFQAHLVHTMHPWYELMQQSAMVNLLTDDELDEGYYFRFVINALMHASLQAKAEYCVKMYGIGALNPNEIREFDERNPYEGGEKFRVPLNMADPLDEPEPKPAGDDPANPAPKKEETP